MRGGAGARGRGGTATTKKVRAPDGGIAWLPRMPSVVGGRVLAVEACVCQYPVAYGNGFAMPVHAAQGAIVSGDVCLSFGPRKSVWAHGQLHTAFARATAFL